MLWGKRTVAITWLCGALAGCGGAGAGDDGHEVTRFDVSGEVPRELMGRMDAVWIGLRALRNDEPDQVVISHDGRTWQVAELPGRPAELELAHGGPKSVHVEPNLAAVVGRDRASVSSDWPISKSEFIVWTTSDGVDWDVHVLGTAGGIVGNPTVTAAGPVLITSTSSVEGFNMFTSRDGGSSWQPAVISGLDHVPGEDTILQWASADGDGLQMVVGVNHGPVGRRQALTSTDDGTTWSATPCGDDGCTPPGEAGDLRFRHGEVSADGGATWDDVTVEPTMTGDGPPSMSGVVQVPGGWLSRAATDEASDVSYQQLVRSDDGRSWRQVLPADPCAESSGRPNSQVSRPVPIDGRLYVAYGCSDLSMPEFAMVYTGDPDAREFRLVDDSERDGAVFGTPIEDRDRLILPEYGGDDELVGITTIG